MPNANRAYRFVIMLLLVSPLTGCGLSRAQVDAATRFAAASRVLSQAATQQTARIRADVIDLRTRRFRLERALATNPADEPRPPIDAGVELDQAERRLAAMGALGDLADLIDAVAAPSTGSDAALAADRLVDALRRADATDLTDRQARALRDAAAAAGSGLFTADRTGTLRRVLVRTRAPVGDLSRAVESSFDPDAYLWLTNLTNERDEARRLLRRVGVPQRDRTALAAQSQILADDAERRTADALAAAARITDTARALRAAHADLIDVLTSPRDDAGAQIDEFFDRAERLADAAAVLLARPTSPSEDPSTSAQTRAAIAHPAETDHEQQRHP